MPDSSNQIGAVVDHPAVGPDDGKTSGDILHTWWIEGTVETRRGGSGAGVRMIGQQQGQRHLWVALFCRLDHAGGKAVKTTVVPDKKICYVVLGNVPLHRLGQGVRQAFACLTVADEKTGSREFTENQSTALAGRIELAC